MTALVALAFLLSHNVFLTLGINLPFEAENERLKSKRDYANIVFSGKEKGGNTANL